MRIYANKKKWKKRRGERLGLRRDGDCVIIKAQKMMGHFDFAAAGSSVRKTCWIIGLFVLMVKDFMAGSYGILRE